MSDTAQLAPGVIRPPSAAGRGRELEAHWMAAATITVASVIPDRIRRCPVFGPFVTAADLERRFAGRVTFAEILDRYGSSRHGAAARSTRRARRR